MMREGLATPCEIAQAGDISLDTVVSWRRRAGIDTARARIKHVRSLLKRKPRMVLVIDDPEAAPF